MSAVRRVLMTADAVGGVWTYALDLSRMLGEHGIEVVLAVMGPLPAPAQRAQAAAIPSLRLVERGYRLEWMDDPWSDVARAADWLLALERRFAPDLVHLNGYVHATLPFRAPVLVVGHSCVLSWWQAVKGEPAPARYAQYRERVRAGLTAAACVVAPTQAMLDALARYYGPLEDVAGGAREQGASRARVLANGCDLERFVPRTKRAQIAAAGRIWDEAKSLDSLIRVAPELPWPVSIAGEAERPARRRGETPVRKGSALLPHFAGTRQQVLRLGALSRAQLAELFGHAAIAAFPARYEPFGLSTLEAAACGAALVLGDIPSLRELWNGVACFVPPGDERALVDALRRLAQDAAERERLGRRARARAERFGLARFVQSYRELYDELAAQARPHHFARPSERGFRPFASAARARASQLRTSHV